MRIHLWYVKKNQQIWNTTNEKHNATGNSVLVRLAYCFCWLWQVWFLIKLRHGQVCTILNRCVSSHDPVNSAAAPAVNFWWQFGVWSEQERGRMVCYRLQYNIKGRIMKYHRDNKMSSTSFREHGFLYINDVTSLQQMTIHRS